MRNFVLLFSIVTLIFASCSKSDTIEATGDVNIYLIKSFVESEDNDYIDLSTVVLEDSPLLEYDDLVSYNKETYTFKIKDDKKSEFSLDGNTIHFRAFAVVVDDEIIYTGFFWPSYSSQGINWVVVDPIMVEMSGELNVALGYPGMLNNYPIPDERNDSKIINIFERDDKLID